MANEIKVVITNAGLDEIVAASQAGTDQVLITEIGYGTGQYTASAEQTSLHHRPAPSLQEENNLSTDFDFNSAVELRKAVIYAEILNRKY